MIQCNTPSGPDKLNSARDSKYGIQDSEFEIQYLNYPIKPCILAYNSLQSQRQQSRHEWCIIVHQCDVRDYREILQFSTITIFALLT